MSNSYNLLFNDPESNLLVLIEDLGKLSEDILDFVEAFKASLSDNDKKYVDLVSEYQESPVVSFSDGKMYMKIMDLYDIFCDNYKWSIT